MKILSVIRDALLDFLFPKKTRVVELESITPGKLLKILPPAENIKDPSVIALFEYSHSLVRELVWELKYKGNKIIAEKLSEILADTIVSELEEKNLFEKFERPVLIPSPISDKRRLARGWNQAELLANAVKEKLGNRVKYMPRQLVKHVHTESQTTTSSKRERQQNLLNTMKVLNPPSVEDRCVILIDDVYTTGSTFAEAKRALKAAGAKKIICFAVAH